MFKFLKTGAMAAALAAGALFSANPAEARDRYRGGGDDDAAIAIGAGIIGLAIGAAIASDNDDGYYDDRRHYRPQYRNQYYYNDYDNYPRYRHHYRNDDRRWRHHDRRRWRDHDRRHWRGKDRWRGRDDWRGHDGWRGDRGRHHRGRDW